MFSDSRCKNACKMLADLCPCFHQSPTRPNFGRSRVKVCPILCRLRTKLCPNFGRSRAKLCPISFAPCPFPNLAGTLQSVLHNASNHITEQNTGALAPLLVADIYWSTTEDSSNNCELPMKVRYNLYNANK